MLRLDRFGLSQSEITLKIWKHARFHIFSSATITVHKMRQFLQQLSSLLELYNRNFILNFRVNFAQRTELVFRELEEMQISFQLFQKRSAAQNNHLDAEIEEMNIRSGEIEDGRKVFEENIIVGGVDALTQRIPAEKFIR